MKIIGIIFISRHVVERCRRGVLPSKMDLRSLSDWSIYDPRDVGHECDGVTWFLLTSVLPMNRPVASWLPHRARPRIESPGSHLFSSPMQSGETHPSSCNEFPRGRAISKGSDLPTKTAWRIKPFRTVFHSLTMIQSK